MSFKDSLEERQKAARISRRAMLERFAARPGPDDPASAKKRAARQAISAARDSRRAELEQRKQAEREAQAVQAALDAAQRQQQLEQADREAAEQVEQDAALKIAQKKARDSKYAARKAGR